MKPIGNGQILSFLGGAPTVKKVTNYQIRSNRGPEVTNFPDLVEKVAQLSFYNPDQVLLFRGQSQEYLSTRSNTSIKPWIFRPQRGLRVSPGGGIIDSRYRRLREAEKQIVAAYQNRDLLGKTRVTRSRLLQWAILQHYEVCATPLLDVTHSLRVAASFALRDNGPDPVVYALAVPSLAGTITVCPEQEIQILRLTSICPPNAPRPYFQEGYLLGGYPDLTSYEEKRNYKPYEVDFGARVIAKFHLLPDDFWPSRTTPPSLVQPFFRMKGIRSSLSPRKLN
jgi:hypothetical protein